MEAHRVHPLDPGGVLHPQRMVELQQRPALQNVRRREPALRQPPAVQQLPQMQRISLIGLGTPFGATQRRGLGRLPQMRDGAHPGQLLGHIPPPRAGLHRKLHRPITGGVEALVQPAGQVGPVRRRDLATPQLAGVDVEVVEGDLLSVDVQSTYDSHGTSSSSRGHAGARARVVLTPIVTRLS
jgi:hypothetical protein